MKTPGYKCCPVCHQIMAEDVDDRGDSYYVCPCGHKQRIFHKRTCIGNHCQNYFFKRSVSNYPHACRPSGISWYRIVR